MKKIEFLYRKFLTKEQYQDINEVKILSSLYEYSTDSLEVVISRLINEAVLGHMNINIDSTIMQMLALNDYLCSLFMKNLETLVYNYAIHYLEQQGIEEVDHELEEKIEECVKQVDMKTELPEFIERLSVLCKLSK